MTTSISEQIETGRFGIKYVDLQEAELVRDHHVISFMRKLFQINGFDTTTTKYDPHHPRIGKATPFNHEIVIPEDATHPLVVIKGSYEARDRSEVEYELRRNREQGEWGQWMGAEAGKERYGLYTPPTELGRFNPILEVSHRKVEGGSGTATSSGISVYHNGEYIPGMLTEDISDELSWSEREQLRQISYSDRLKLAVASAVELIKVV